MIKDKKGYDYVEIQKRETELEKGIDRIFVTVSKHGIYNDAKYELYILSKIDKTTGDWNLSLERTKVLERHWNIIGQ